MARHPELKWEGASALVTGASSGIGRALALELGRRGTRLAIVARRQGELERVAQAVVDAGGAPPAVVVADLARPGAAACVADEATDRLGAVDVLVNNAGGGGGGLQWAAADTEIAREIFEINLWSPLALVAALVPRMRQRGAGAVVNVTSIAQVSTWPSMGHYAASKAALAVCTETLRLELTGTGVHVMQVIPGPVDTAVQGETRLVPGLEDGVQGIPLGSAAVLAERIADGVARRRERVVYPRAVLPMYTFPGLVRSMTARRVKSGLDRIDRDETRVRRSGSLGDPLAREARDAWERGERDLSALQQKARKA
jgi:uncharacterized protein